MSQSFRTEIKIEPSDLQIDHTQKIMTIGSCFSQVIGDRLSENKFDVQVNPFGTIFNPISIFKMLNSGPLYEGGYLENDEMFFHYDLHSDLRAKDRKTLETIAGAKKQASDAFLNEADWLIITLGTAWVYERTGNNQIVANCHKVPQREFKKRLLGMKEIVSAFDLLIEKLQKRNANLKVILTVSPVRHVKDGLAENNLSKSLLRVFCDYACQSHYGVFYFPSYEIVMDDLRDYRYFREDLIHPNLTAETYIWERFQETYFSKQTSQILSDWSKVLGALKHRPFNADSTAHQQFLKKQIEKLAEFEPHFSVKDEIKQFKSQLVG